MKASHLRISIGLFTFGLILVLISYFTRFEVCVTESLQGVHYVLFFKSSLFKKPFKRGDIVLIEGHSPKYVGEKRLTKKVFGLPGDEILHNQTYNQKGLLRVIPQRVDDELLGFIIRDPSVIKAAAERFGPGYYDSFAFLLYDTLAFPLLDKTKAGNPLTPLGSSFVPEGYVFAVGDALDSFDSRYEEFGLVPQDKIWGRAVMTW